MIVKKQSMEIQGREKYGFKIILILNIEHFILI